jgi:hypothetical protein
VDGAASTHYLQVVGREEDRHLMAAVDIEVEHSVAAGNSTVDRGEERRNKAMEMEVLRRISQVAYPYKDVEP